MSKTTGFVLAAIGVAVLGFLILWLTDVDVVDGGELPSTDDVSADAGALLEVEVEGGELPSVDVDCDLGSLHEIDVDVADIDVGTKNDRSRSTDNLSTVFRFASTVTPVHALELHFIGKFAVSGE